MFKEPVETPDESEPEADESVPPAGSLTLPAAEEVEDPVSICDINFAELLEGSPISLGIYSDSANLAHSVTLWAVEYDNDGNLTTIWLTDSDDYENRIFSVQVTLDKEENKIYFGTLVEGEGEEEDDYYDMDDDDEDDEDDDFDSFDDDDAPTPKTKKKKKREDDDF